MVLMIMENSVKPFGPAEYWTVFTKHLSCGFDGVVILKQKVVSVWELNFFHWSECVDVFLSSRSDCVDDVAVRVKF